MTWRQRQRRRDYPSQQHGERRCRNWLKNRERPRVALAMRQSIHFTTSSDGTRIAWGLAGRGPALVRAPAWLSHIEYDWQSPVSRHWITEFTRSHTLLRVDPRGIGMSQWDVEDLSFDGLVRDVEAAVDAAGLRSFEMVGDSGGAAVAIAYAARHPERVTRLFLWGSYCRGSLRRGEPSPERLEQAQMLRRLAEIGWGSEEPAFRQVFASLLVPGATKEQWLWFADRMRLCCTGRNAARFLAMMEQIDVQDLARQVRCPTLMLHSRHEARNPYEEGKLTATLIPNAEFVALDSLNHILLWCSAWRRQPNRPTPPSRSVSSSPGPQGARPTSGRARSRRSSHRRSASR